MDITIQKKYKRILVECRGTVKELYISRGIKDYTDLIKTIVEKCEKYENIKIDKEVRDLIKINTEDNSGLKY